MDPKTQPTLRTPACAAALLTVAVLAWAAPPPAEAQLGSLVVTTTSPTTGSTVGGTIPVNASVTIIGLLTVAGVQFKLDGANLGAEDTSQPYSVPWNTKTASNGSHTLRAVARDALGILWTSAPVTVTVFNDLAPPTVSVTSPSAGAAVRGSITVSASASDNVGVVGVQFRLDGANLGAEDTTGPYGVSWNTTTAAGGAHTLTAVARDAAGNTATSSGVTVTVDNTPPSAAINQAGGQTDPTGASPINFTVVFSEAVSGFTGADVTIGGTAGGTKTVTVSGGPSTYTAAVSGMTGGTVTATIAAGAATDGAGNASGASASTDNTVTFDLSSPGVTVNQAAGQLDPTNGSPLNFTVAFSEAVSGFTGADVTVGGTAGGTKTVAVTGGPGTYNVAVSGMTNGTVIASIAAGVAVDSGGNPNTASTSTDNTVTFDSMPPTVSITAPGAGAAVSGTITVTGDAADASGVAGVQFFRDGSALGAEDDGAPYSLAWDTTTVANGPYTLTAVARDTVGNSTSSAGVSVTVSNGPPPPPPTSTVTRFEDLDPSVTYTDGTMAPGQPPGWWHGSRSRSWSGVTSSFNRSAGARAIFTFNGTVVRWITFRAHWAGIARASLDGGPFTEIDLFSPPDPADPRNGEQVQAIGYEATGLAAGPHTLIVEATGRKHGAEGCDPVADPLNCASDWAVVVDAFDVGPSSPPTVSGTRSEQASLTYTPATNGTPWTQGDTSQPWSGGTAAANGAAGARATFSFNGTSVSWIGFQGPQNGIARVSLDGAFHAEVDTYAATQRQAAVHTIDGLAAARHTLVIEATGLKNAASTGTAVVVDAVDVRSRFEETSPAITYSASWVRENTAKAWSGTSGNTGTGTAARSQSAGEQATFAFTGTAVSWISFRAPLAGIANVFIDGGFVAQVDLYSAAEEVRLPVFTSGPLANGPHTLRIDVTGNRNPAATGAFVFVDAFDVTLPSSLPTVQRRQENDASVSYTPSAEWTRGTRFQFDTGEFAMGSYGEGSGQPVAIAGARAAVTFTATAVRWIGRRSFSGGIARVYLDGALVATVDTLVPFTSQEEYQAVLYEATGLAPGTHTLEIELIGRNGEPAGTPVPQPVWLDAFDVY
jgi:hypothetical protein